MNERLLQMFEEEESCLIVERDEVRGSDDYQAGVIDGALATTRMVLANLRRPHGLIETKEELDALPDGSVVREINGDYPSDVLQKFGKWWYPTGTDCADTPMLPARLLWAPSAGEVLHDD